MQLPYSGLCHIFDCRAVYSIMVAGEASRTSKLGFGSPMGVGRDGTLPCSLRELDGSVRLYDISQWI
jgi:hypothetical protein